MIKVKTVEAWKLVFYIVEIPLDVYTILVLLNAKDVKLLFVVLPVHIVGSVRRRICSWWVFLPHVCASARVRTCCEWRWRPEKRQGGLTKTHVRGASANRPYVHDAHCYLPWLITALHICVMDLWSNWIVQTGTIKREQTDRKCPKGED